MVLFVLLADFLIFRKKIFGIGEKIKKKIKLPPTVLSILIAFILLTILASLVFGISFIPSTVKDVISHAVEPFDQTRFGVTVAENKQPYFLGD
jgi:hypothetical protein